MWRGALWWGGYLILAIWLQKFFPGLDALAPACIICLQEESRERSMIFLLFCIIIQEGAGTFPFGLSIVWYSLIMLMYYVGQWFFMSGNFMFVAALSLALGLGRLIVAQLAFFLHPLRPDLPALLAACALQIIFTPPLWLLGYKSRSVLRAQR
ncbi:MAG: hypothetical protein LBD82_05660 [Deltaproteobacteria bacterium]|jgi:hypothetical protein|nr:hypothetical protein [Deltaproteobacteria bacterium]